MKKPLCLTGHIDTVPLGSQYGLKTHLMEKLTLESYMVEEVVI